MTHQIAPPALQPGEIDIGFDEDDRDSDPPTEVDGLITGAEGELDFSPDDLAHAQSLTKYSSKTIIGALVSRSVNIKLLDMRVPEEMWTTKNYGAYAAFVSTLGSSKMTERPLGKFEYDAMLELEDVPSNVLLATLVTARMPATKLLTDLTLAREVANIIGVSVSVAPGVSQFTIPGFAGMVCVSLEGVNKGRVVSGGEEFVRWHNSLYKSTFVYEKMSPLASDMAFALLALYSIKLDKVDLKITERPKQSKSGFVDIIGSLVAPIAARPKALKSHLIKAWSDPSNRPIMSAKYIIAFIECVLTRYLEGCSSSIRDEMKAVFSQARSEAAKRWLDLAAASQVYMKGVEAISLTDVKNVIVGLTPICGKVMSCLGSVRSFVEESRIVFRDDLDLIRKSDAMNMGSSAGAATSVPEKVSRAIMALRAISGVTRFPVVDAFGTGAANHMSVTVDAVSDNVTYFDRNIKFRPPLGQKFQERDVEALEPGSGKGKYIFDDTYNAPDENETGTSKFNATRKIDAIISAGYEGGFMKLYLGAGTEADCAFNVVPKTIQKIADAYDRFNLVPGGTLHSPEYFIVFSRGVRDNWAPPAMPESGYSYGGRDCDPSERAALVVRYIRNWISYRSTEIIRANIRLNFQIASGVVDHYALSSMSGFVRVDHIRLGGAVSLSSASVGEKDVKGGLGDDSLDFLEGN